MASWGEATAVQKLGSKTYSCTFYDEWCIGSVPNGGYVTGCILEVVSKHFSTSLARQNQPHTIALHVEFLRRTQAGPATFKIEEVKLGRQTSIVHVHVSQDGREEIIAYATNSNMDTEDGVSFDTQYELYPRRPTVDFSKLERNTDENWKWNSNMPFPTFRKATAKVKFHLPVSGQVLPSIADQWVCFADGTNFTDSSIGFVADMFPQILEWHRNQKKSWYPTLLLNLDVKKTLPPEGVKWLGNRVQIKKLHKGRMDLEVHILDAEGDIVALSHHVALVVDASRNLAERSGSDSKI
ncbi:hypothetical protein DM02DRAFT_618173 [Periconia macrospinosa]|uniref:Thioesterase-like superfamily-domain-containing protein n=1 Tax=Periconia macrospinosa TaxID=97972 RepID=A0A2V1DAF4_9PLEO|nr:hypothetical protein DM02DRAFT_618173 [Periconia macrospinosa]